MDRENVFPVFLEIDPDDVRYIVEEAAAVSKEFQKFPLPSQEFVRVVKAVPGYTGLRAKGKFWDTCMHLVRKELLRRLEKLEGGFRLSEAGFLIGMENHMGKLKRLLGVTMAHYDEGSSDQSTAEIPPAARRTEVGIAGIKGMGGIGKSTLGKQLYDDAAVRSFFTGGICWLEVNENPSDDHICRLQKQVLRTICNMEGVKIHNAAEGRARLRAALSAKRVLIVLDNVWEGQGSKSVLSLDCLGPGSCILKTTRDSKTIGADGLRFDLDVLDEELAWELFCWHAFMGEQPPDRLEKSARCVVERCGGLPLALEIVGARVAEDTRGQPDDYVDTWWKEELIEKLQKNQLGAMTDGRQASVQAILRTSYDGLPRQDMKDAFILVAFGWRGVGTYDCTLGDYEYRSLAPMLGALIAGPGSAKWKGEQFVTDLKHRSLIKLEGTGPSGSPRLVVHDLFMEFALNIVLGEKRFTTCLKHIPDWDPEHTESGGFMLTNKVGGLVEHLAVVHTGGYFDQQWDIDTLLSSQLRIPKARIPGRRGAARLRSIVLQGCQVPSLRDLRNCQLLSLRRRCSGPFLGDHDCTSFCHCLRSLATRWSSIDLRGMTAIYEHLELIECFTLKKPPALQGLTSLTHLSLKSCWLLYTPPNLGDLPNLRHLDLSWCCALMKPPDVRGLLRLQHLNLNGCMSLTEPPAELQGLSSLQILDFMACKFMVAPPILSGLTALQSLNFRGCLALSRPPEVRGLVNLQFLDLRGCFALVELPDIQGLSEGCKTFLQTGEGCLVFH